MYLTIDVRDEYDARALVGALNSQYSKLIIGGQDSEAEIIGKAADELLEQVEEGV